MNSINVRVKVAGTYTDPDFRAITPPSKKGDIITIAGGSHALWLRDQGMVSFLGEEESEAAELMNDLKKLNETITDDDESGDAVVISTNPDAPRPSEVVKGRRGGKQDA
jgi:hypothetical protein